MSRKRKVNLFVSEKWTTTGRDIETSLVWGPFVDSQIKYGAVPSISLSLSEQGHHASVSSLCLFDDPGIFGDFCLTFGVSGRIVFKLFQKGAT